MPIADDIIQLYVKTLKEKTKKLKDEFCATKNSSFNFAFADLDQSLYSGH
jgi:hypothetical protein